ncbi:hypothetical protein ACVWW4_003693 [Bradyrhizobium sp. LB7.1]
MEYLKLLVDFAKAIAWPSAVFALEFMFRSDVRELFPRLNPIFLNSTKKNTFDEWVRYPISAGLITSTSDEIAITDFGQEFLNYLLTLCTPMKTPLNRAPLPTGPAELSTALEAAFAGRATIGVPELAALIPMHRETIARHIAAGNLVGRLKGLGRTRRHRVFTIGDVARFMQLITDEPRSQPPEFLQQAGNFAIRFGNGATMRVMPPKRRGR